MTRPASTHTETITVGDTRYSRVFTDEHGRSMVTVHEPDGDSYITYGVLPQVVSAWAQRDLSTR